MHIFTWDKADGPCHRPHTPALQHPRAPGQDLPGRSAAPLWYADRPGPGGKNGGKMQKLGSSPLLGELPFGICFFSARLSARCSLASASECSSLFLRSSSALPPPFLCPSSALPRSRGIKRSGLAPLFPSLSPSLSLSLTPLFTPLFRELFLPHLSVWCASPCSSAPSSAL